MKPSLKQSYKNSEHLLCVFSASCLVDIETVVSDVLARQVALWMLVDCIRRMEWVLVWDVGGLVTQRLFARSEVKFSWI